MPYEDDYKMWLEDMFIKMNPDWLCDGMADKEFTHDWCEKYCGKDSDYITPKCLHIYYHHIARADRKTEPQTCDDCVWNVCNYNKVDWERTDTEIAKAIVHKMIDDAVIAEDAYPDLRQKMHDAVDEYEPQMEREGE